MKSDTESRSGFSQITESGAGSESKTQDPPGVDSGSVATSCVGPFWHAKDWVICLTFSITARSASASAVVFFGLLEPLSYVLFDILKLMQVILLYIYRYPDYFEKKRKNLHVKFTLLSLLS